MPPKVYFFAGAPEARTLLSHSNQGLLNKFEESFERFTGLGHQSRLESSENAFSPAALYWRSLPYERQHLVIGHSQNIWKEGFGGARFFASSCIDSHMEDISAPQLEHVSSVLSVEEVLSQFYEQSYGLHQDILSSQLQAVSQSSRSSDGSSSYNTIDSFDTKLNSVSLNYLQETLPNCQVCNLKEVPNARYIEAMNPQTLTVNLIVGLIAVPQPRMIRTRRGVDIKLVEIIVGDETKSGFVINFWIPTTTSENESPLQDLRPQDVVLLRNVALSSFRGRVYGQSLRKDMTRAHLLYRNKLDTRDVGGFYKSSDFSTCQAKDAILSKTSSVREWVKLFVAAPERKHVISAISVTERLPPDTPP